MENVSQSVVLDGQIYERKTDDKLEVNLQGRKVTLIDKSFGRAFKASIFGGMIAAHTLLMAFVAWHSAMDALNGPASLENFCNLIGSVMIGAPVVSVGLSIAVALFKEGVENFQAKLPHTN